MNHFLKDKFLLKITLLTVIAPFIALSFFNHPAADDYCYAGIIKNTPFIDVQLHWYREWSGRYFTNALLSLYPLLSDFFLMVKILPLLLFFGLFTSFWLCLHTLSQNQVEKKETSFAAFSLLVIYLLNSPSPVEGFYWFAGSITYQVSNILILLLFTLLFSLGNIASQRRSKRIITLCSFLAFLIAGSNESILLVLLLLLFFGVLLTFQKRRNVTSAWIIVFSISLLGGAISALAPGNSERMAHFPNCCNLWFALSSSYKQTLLLFFSWTKSIELLSISALFLPVAASVSKKIKGINEIKIGSVFLFIFLWMSLVASSMFPAFWSIGSAPPPRALNTSYFIFFIGWFASLVLVSASFPNMHKKMKPIFLKLFKITLITGLLLNVHFQLSLDDLFLYAPSYNKQLEKRYERIEDGKREMKKVLTVPGLKNPPETLFFGDIIVNSEHWKNQCYARFFNLKSIKTDSVTSDTL